MFGEIKFKSGQLLAILIILMLGCWFTYGKIKWGNISDAKSNNSGLVILPSSNTTVLEDNIGAASKVSVATKLEDKDKKPYLDDSEAYRINIWRISHGYYAPETLAEYSTYDMSTLIQLSQSGDVRAMQLLALMRLKNGEFDAAFDEYIHAAIHGSTYALTAASEFYENKYMLASTEEDKAINAVSALALLKVAVMRGDVLVENTQIKMFKRLRNFSPTQEQDEQIARRAEEIYKHLESERISQGLGHFDNSTGDEVDRLAKMVNHLKG